MADCYVAVRVAQERHAEVVEIRDDEIAQGLVRRARPI